VIKSGNNTSRFPKGWIQTSLGEIAEINPKLPCVLEDNTEVTFLPMKAVEELTGKFDASIFVPYIEVRKGYTAFINGDIIFAKITPCMENGKVAVVGNLKSGVGFGSTEFHVIRPFLTEFPGKYVFYYLIQESFRRDAKRDMTGSAGQLRVPAKYMQDASLPLPPLPEQVRIVARLEELFARLDAGVEGLRKVKAQLKRYRQAVLKHAFEGKLTEEWRRTHKHQTEPASLFLERLMSERRKEFSRAKGANLLEVPNSPPLPDGWSWSSLEQLSQDIIDCLHSTPSFTETGKYCVDTNCIEQNRILFDKARFVSEETFRERVRRLVPKAGDVLFAREGTIGTAVSVSENMELCLGQRMMLFRPANEILSAYFMWGLLSPIFESQWKPKVMGTTAPHVNIRDLKQMYLPLTCQEEQRVIVDEIEAHTAIIYQAEVNVDKSIKQVERLRQSILASAFEGKLAPQDPSDEPAEKLLERIREERAKSKGEKDTNRRRKNRPRKLELSTYVK
jgi:type I restriction enzyme S subunit